MRRVAPFLAAVLAAASAGCTEGPEADVPVVRESSDEPEPDEPQALDPGPATCEVASGSVSADDARAAVSAQRAAVAACLEGAGESEVGFYFSSRPDESMEGARQLGSQFTLSARPSAEAAGCLDDAGRAILGAMAADWPADEAIGVSCTLPLR